MADIPDLGALTRPQQKEIQFSVLIADMPKAGEQTQLVTAQALVDAILAGVRAIVKEELNAAVAE
jgi:hypothetical protein